MLRFVVMGGRQAFGNVHPGVGRGGEVVHLVAYLTQRVRHQECVQARGRCRNGATACDLLPGQVALVELVPALLLGVPMDTLAQGLQVPGQDRMLRHGQAVELARDGAALAQLVQERMDQVRVVHLQRDLLEDPVRVNVVPREPVPGLVASLVERHECVRQSVRLDGQRAVGGPERVVDDDDRVRDADLVVVLCGNDRRPCGRAVRVVHHVAGRQRLVPPDAVAVDVHLAKKFHHLQLERRVITGGRIIVLLVVLDILGPMRARDRWRGRRRRWHGEASSHLELPADVQTKQLPGHGLG